MIIRHVDCKFFISHFPLHGAASLLAGVLHLAAERVPRRPVLPGVVLAGRVAREVAARAVETGRVVVPCAVQLLTLEPEVETFLVIS